MNIYHVRHGSILPLGKQGENMARKIQFDISRWIGTFGPGTVQLLHQRSGDEAPYPVAVEQEGNLAVWTVTSADTAAAGTGRAELQYYVGDALAKSETWMTKVLAAMGPAGETPPEAQQGWVDQVLQAGAAATEAAEKAANAAVRQPYPNAETGTWWVWNAESGAYEDTGISYGTGGSGGGVTDHEKLTGRDKADQHPMIAITGLYDALAGKQPTGTYLTDETDPTVPDWAKQPEKPSYTADEVGALSSETLPEAITTALAQAKESGEFDGAAGQDGAPGQDGITPTIGDNGNWYLGDTDTGKPSRGETGQAGADGRDGADGQPGADGKSAYQYAVEGGYTGTEEAFAAKLAKEKFANPNALTFTGAVTGRYDGSAPLEVEIPSGGGGLTVTNTAAVGQTVKITAVDENGQPTEWEAVDMTEQVQPDWNQNDSTSADYVKNRTHYEESTYVDYVLNMEGTDIVGLSAPEVGETMTVKINGVESAETVKEAESSILGTSYKYIGNIDIDSLVNGGTGWCFLVGQGEGTGFANPDSTIALENIVVHKINDKFINFDGFVRTFDYHFNGNYTIYKTLYDDGGNKVVLYIYNNIILPESSSQLFGFMGKTGFSIVGSTMEKSCFVTGVIINNKGNITVNVVVLGTNTTEMEQLAANYGYTLTTNPNA